MGRRCETLPQCLGSVTPSPMLSYFLINSVIFLFHSVNFNIVTVFVMVGFEVSLIKAPFKMGQ